MFHIRDFMEKNQLVATEDEAVTLMQEKIEKKALVGFQSRGMVAGMVSADLQAVGMNTLFPNGIYVSCYKEAPCEETTLYLVPQTVMVGVECTKAFCKEELKQQIEEVLAQRNLFSQAIGGFATLEGMEQTEAIQELAKEYGVEVTAYTKDELLSVEGMFSIGELTDLVDGVDKVCERACVKRSEAGDLILRKSEKDGFSFALAMKNYIVSFR